MKELIFDFVFLGGFVFLGFNLCLAFYSLQDLFWYCIGIKYFGMKDFEHRYCDECEKEHWRKSNL